MITRPGVQNVEDRWGLWRMGELVEQRLDKDRSDCRRINTMSSNCYYRRPVVVATADTDVSELSA